MTQSKLDDFDELFEVALSLEQIRPEVINMAHGEVNAVFDTSLDVNNTQKLKCSVVEATKIYANSTDNMLTQLRILGAKQDEVEKRTNLTVLEIAKEKDSNGKLKFTNESMRKAELADRMDNDPNALREKDELWDIEMELKEAEELRRVAKTILKSIEIISTL